MNRPRRGPGPQRGAGPERRRPRRGHSGGSQRAKALAEGDLGLVATCGAGVETLLVGELEKLGMRAVEPSRGAVSFVGTWRDCWRANLHLRTANRVLAEVGTFRAESDEDLYPAAKALFDGDPSIGGVPFSEIAHPKRSLAIRASSRASRIQDVRWLALKIKDALVDSQRDRFGRRGDVARRGADVPLRIFLRRNLATVLLDTSGRPLDHRGYRLESTTAPVREQLAAACFLAAEYEGEGPIFDPMCGSGTLLIESSWALDGGVPGRLRRTWVFERWPSLVRAELKELMEAAQSFAATTPLIGADSDAEAIAAARVNLEAAGVADVARVRRANALAEPPPADSGLLIVNPAYGKRLANSPEFWPQLGDLLKKHYKGWRAVVLAGDEDRGKRIGLRARRRLSVWNGSIEARILVFDLF
ncbi:MAG: hypothetical protein AAGK22_08160 [Acidobacteriota bacterium]